MKNPQRKILQLFRKGNFLEKALYHSEERTLGTFKCCFLGLRTQFLLSGLTATDLLLKEVMLLLPLLPATSLCSTHAATQIRELNQLEVTTEPKTKLETTPKPDSAQLVQRHKRHFHCSALRAGALHTSNTVLCSVKGRREI